MENIQLLIITAIGSLLAAIVSFINIYFTKKKITSDIFPQIRYERLKDIKNAIDSFIDAYFEEANLEPANRNKLKQKLLKVEITFNYLNTQAYVGLKKELYRYVETNIPITDHKLFIEETQKLLNWIMDKAKLEVGITPSVEKKYKKLLDKKYII